MGVNGLESFTKTEFQLEKINLREKIEEKSNKLNASMKPPKSLQKFTVQPLPILIFDAQSLMGSLPHFYYSQNEHENIFGGRHWTCSERLEAIFNELKNYGAELVFFFDGSPQNEKLEEWKKRRDEKYGKQVELMRFIKIGNQTVQTVDEKRLLGCNFHYNKNMLSIVKATCEKFGKVYISEKNECDREIMSYIYNNERVMGVFAGDSDFLVFPKVSISRDFRYYAMNSICLREGKILTVKEYPRSKLRNELGLNPLQMAIFATLCGNDFMEHRDVKIIHQYLAQSGNVRIVDDRFDRVEVLHKISKFVKNNFIKPNELYETLLHFIENNVTKDYDYRTELLQTVKSSKFKKNFEFSVKFYMDNINLKLTSDLFPDAFSNNLNYKILNNLKKSLMPYFHDFLDVTMGKFKDLFISRIKRQVGAVFKIKSTENRKFSILTKLEDESRCQVIEIDPDELPYEIDISSIDCKFKLLKWLCHMENIEIFQLETFPDKYIVDVLTMCCLFMNKAITLKEMDLLLLTVFAYHEKLIPNYLPLPEENIINYRAFCIPHIYGRIHYEILYSIEICGLRQKLWNPINLDGVYFHIEYLHYSKTGRSSGERLELNKPMKKELKNRFNALRDKLNYIGLLSKCRRQVD